MRSLEKVIAKVIRSRARHIAMETDYNKKLTLDDITEILGAPRFQKEKYISNETAGVVTGLAWTAVGGEILFIETSLSPGKGTLTLTGNLGDVMKESATIAMEYIRAHAHKMGIDPEVFRRWNVHMHVPEGATPKDGPSAGITMFTALASAFTQRKVRKSRGRVLPVGGIKEKILAAKRSKIKDIILCAENRKDIEEIKEDYIKGLNFIYVENMLDVLEHALLKEKVKEPLDLLKIAPPIQN